MSLRFRHFACVAGLALVLAGCSKPAPSEGEKIAKGSDCFSCHALDHQIVGPSFNDVAKKFATEAGAEDTLVDAIQNGHTGTWGKAQMPAHPDLKREQIQEIVRWILALNAAPAASQAAAAPGQSYNYTTLDGKPVTADFQIFQDGTKKASMSVFHGYEQFNSYCFRCHGEDATGGSFAPDLRRSLTNGMTLDQFRTVAMEGRKAKGMPSWAGFFKPEQITEIYQYVKARQLNVVDVGIPEQ